jgi:DNA-directed RNA polymerase subunit M/transcription elongation factor TFIIS
MNIKLFSIPIEFYINKEYNYIRRNLLILLADLFEKYIIKNNLNIDYKNLENIVITIEKSIYNKVLCKTKKYKNIWDKNFIFLYTSYSSKITKNLDIDIEHTDSYLIKNILNNSLDINKIINLKSYKLSPIKTKEIIDKIFKQISIKNEDIIQKTSTMYKCKACGEKKCIIKEFQARSLDEASNLSLTCTVCNNAWVV